MDKAGVQMSAPPATLTRPYHMMLAEMTSCAHCGGAVYLMCEQGPDMELPAFYVCWRCKTVAQVGVGRVPVEPVALEE